MASGLDTESSSSRLKSMICAVCLEIYRDPKFLPCHHTFCAGCVQSWADGYRGNEGKFPCPYCRKETSLPPGGVAALQSNFYFSTDDLERAREGKLCVTHNQKELEFFCVRCEEAICINCKLTNHEGHETQDLDKVVKLRKKQLIEQDSYRLKMAISLLERRINSARTEKSRVGNERERLESALRARHTTLMAIADLVMDEETTALNTLTASTQTALDSELDELQKKLDEVTTLDKRLTDAISRGAGCELLTVAKELRDGRGSRQSIQLLTSSVPETSVDRLDVSFNASSYAVMTGVRHFLGTVSKVTEADSRPEVVVSTQPFRYGKGQGDVEAFCLCALDNNEVRVMYTQHDGSRKIPVCDVFDENGKLINVIVEGGNLVSLKSVPEIFSKCLYLTTGEGTYSKCANLELLRLKNSSTGKAYVKRDIVLSEKPFKCKDITEFSIKVGAHRAFDVDASEQLFVVLEEPNPPSKQRKVRLYRRGNEDAIDTYTPPSASCQPSDVCFYRLGGRQVLLVSDEGSDAIHVVHVQDAALIFMCYLAPGFSFLVKPTALNTDAWGRLWVACKGGMVLTMTPVA